MCASSPYLDGRDQVLPVPASGRGIQLAVSKCANHQRINQIMKMQSDSISGQSLTPDREKASNSLESISSSMEVTLTIS